MNAVQTTPIFMYFLQSQKKIIFLKIITCQLMIGRLSGLHKDGYNPCYTRIFFFSKNNNRVRLHLYHANSDLLHSRKITIQFKKNIFTT